MAQKWHPDHYEGEEKEKAEKKFIDIGTFKLILILYEMDFIYLMIYS